MIKRLRGIPFVHAVYTTWYSNVYVIFALVAEHRDDVYDAIIQIEDDFDHLVGNIPYQIKVKAHQGRKFDQVVPSNAQMML